MAQNIFDQMNTIFKLMAESKLKNDIDDTLLEKLLSFIRKCRLKSSDVGCDFIAFNHNDHENLCFGFIKELFKRTEVLYLIEKVISSIAAKNENYVIPIKSFTVRFLGLILESPEEIIPYDNLLPLLKNAENELITDHIPSIQDALLVCLSCITKQFKGALWFIDHNLKDFVFSSFNSSSYYVRKSAVSFFINFISQWTSEASCKQKETEEIYLDNFIKCLIPFIIEHINLHTNSKGIIFAECCITILKQLLQLKKIETIIINPLSLAKNIRTVLDCFDNLMEEKEFYNKLRDLLLTVHFVFELPDEVVKDVIKCLIVKEHLNLAIDLASSFASIVWTKPCCPDEIKLFLLPLYILMDAPVYSQEIVFGVRLDFVYNIMVKKMKYKSDCKDLFSASLSAFQKIVPRLNPDYQKCLGMEMLKVSKCSDSAHHHKWLHSVLEDRIIHHCLMEFYSCLLSENVYPSMKCERSDLIFQNILQFLKKPTADCNFLSQLLLLLENVLIFHNKYEISLEETEKDNLIEILCRVLHDNRESVVDSAIHVVGQIINHAEWKDKFSQQNMHLIIWDIAIHGSHDGRIRSTALKVMINSCLEASFLNELKSTKEVTEADIPKILFDLTYDPDFFLQREALSCLFHWIKSKWNELPASSKDFLYTALVSAIKSLDLELKLTSLDVWLWLLEYEFACSSILPSVDIKEYMKHLVNSGFGLSMILAFEDYDQSVQYKAASILSNLQHILTKNEITCDSLKLDLVVESETTKCVMSQSIFEPVSKEEKYEGIKNVMELSTTEQITNISHSSNFSECYDFKQDYYSNDNKSRTCSLSSFWICLWSEKIASILQPNITGDITDADSFLNDIILARIKEHDVQGTPDCY